MKILLVRYHDDHDPNTRLPESLNKVRGVLPPLGLAYIGAVLEKSGHQVKILDAMALGMHPDAFNQEVKHFGAQVVGVSAMTSSFRGALHVLTKAKEFGAITVMGGAHMSVFPIESVGYEDVDYGIIGEGEYPFLQLVNALESNLAVNSIPGLVYKINNTVYMNDAYIHDNLDEIPFPARHLLPMKQYSSLISLYPVATMISGRGCPFQCGFCFKGPSDKKYRVRSAVNVVDEMELLVKEYKVKEIMFYDDTLTLQRNHVVGICNEILRRGLKIKWESPTRIDSIDKDLLHLMKKAGCIRLRYGVESGDPEILKLMNKGIELSKVKEVFKWTKSEGIETFAYFMLGYIHETAQTMSNTIRFMHELDPDLIMITVALPYPKTPLYELAKQEGLVPGDYWREFVLGLRSDSMPYLVKDAEAWMRKAYRSFYLRPSYIARRIKMHHRMRDLINYIQAAEGILNFRMKQ